MEHIGTIDAELVTSYPVPAHINAWSEFNKNPEENLDKICAHLADGGDLVEWCACRGLRFSQLHEWLYKEPSRARRFGHAVDARNEWTKSNLLATLRDLSFGDISEAYNSDGSVKPFSEWSTAARRSIASIQVDEIFEGKGIEKMQVGVTKKLKFTDKLKAIELLMKYHAMLVDRAEVATNFAVDKQTVEALSQLPAEKLTDMILGRK